jgi:hypothetical protein
VVTPPPRVASRGPCQSELTEEERAMPIELLLQDEARNHMLDVPRASPMR